MQQLTQVQIQFYLLTAFGPAFPEKVRTKLEHPSFDSMWHFCNYIDFQGRYSCQCITNYHEL